MTFQIHALPVARFKPLFALTDIALAALGVRRQVVSAKPGFPCRVSLRDGDVGETVLLLNYEHHSAATPYRSSHAIFVRERVQQAFPARGEIPAVLATRLLSVRAFDAAGMMLDADVVAGAELGAAMERLFASAAVSYLHLHNAKQGCYAARVERA